MNATALDAALSALLRVLLPLEKTGVVERGAGPAGGRQVQLRGSGSRLLREAREIAQAVCASRPAAPAA